MAIYMDSTSGHATLATHLSLFRRFLGKKSYCWDFPKTSCTKGSEPGLARQLVFLPAVRNDNQPVQFCHGQSAKCDKRKTSIFFFLERRSCEVKKIFIFNLLAAVRGAQCVRQKLTSPFQVQHMPDRSLR